MKNLAIGCDHAGFVVKERIKEFLMKVTGIVVEDYGCYTAERVDYPDYGSKVARAVQDGLVERGILICKTGIGMSIVANKFKNVRAALCHDKETILMSRKHNNANILVLGAYIFEESTEIFEWITLWLNTEFEGGRHQERLDKINSIEQEP